MTAANMSLAALVSKVCRPYGSACMHAEAGDSTAPCVDMLRPALYAVVAAGLGDLLLLTLLRGCWACQQPYPG